jgi:hypothetical protein
LNPPKYVSIKYTERLAGAGIEPSVGSVGDYDNALAETINGLYKAELIHRRGPWRSFKAVEFADPHHGDRLGILPALPSTFRPSPNRAWQCRPASALQVIFSFEPRSDLLHHFATIGIVY